MGCAVSCVGRGAALQYSVEMREENCAYMDDGNLVMFSEADVDVTVLVDIVELLIKAKVAGGTATLLAELTTVFVVLV